MARKKKTPEPFAAYEALRSASLGIMVRYIGLAPDGSVRIATMCGMAEIGSVPLADLSRPDFHAKPEGGSDPVPARFHEICAEARDLLKAAKPATE